MMKSYKNLSTNEIVAEEDAEEFVLDTLGITMTFKDNVKTLEQREFLDMVVEWYFSGNWIEIYEEE